MRDPLVADSESVIGVLRLRGVREPGDSRRGARERCTSLVIAPHPHHRGSVLHVCPPSGAYRGRAVAGRDLSRSHECPGEPDECGLHGKENLAAGARCWRIPGMAMSLPSRRYLYGDSTDPDVQRAPPGHGRSIGPSSLGSPSYLLARRRRPVISRLGAGLVTSAARPTGRFPKPTRWYGAG